MKQIILKTLPTLTLIISTYVSQAQSIDFMYKPPLELMRAASQAVDNRISNNLKYREELIDWTLELKLKKTDKLFLERINSNYNKLLSMDPEADILRFNRNEDELDKIKLDIKIAINEYSLRINEGNSDNTKNEDGNREVRNKKFAEEMKFYYKNKEYEKVILMLEPIGNAINSNKIIDNKTKINYYTHLANSSFFLSKWNDAIFFTSKAIELSENNIGDLYFIRANSKSNVDDFYGSNSDYDYLIKNHVLINYTINNVATLLNNKACNFLKQKKFKEAKPLVDKAISLDKKTDYIWDTKGEIEYYLGNYPECILAMTNALALKPIANSYYYRGLAYIKKAQKENGCIDLSKAGELGKKEAYLKIKTNCK